MKKGNSFQKEIKFEGIDDFFDYISLTEKPIVHYLRSLIAECLPPYAEKLSYNVPFYYINRRICFIWPGSVPWGGFKDGVMFGFCQGNLLNDELGFFSSNATKVIRYKIFHSIAEIEACEHLLKTYLFMAAELDQSFKRKPTKNLRR